MAKEKLRPDEVIAQRIIHMVEQGNLPPWRKPWKGEKQMPRGVMMKEGQHYRGMNLFFLSMAPFDCPVFLSKKQVLNLGGRIKYEEFKKGWPILFSKPPKYEENENGKAEKVESGVFRYYMVWNYEQTEGVTLPKKVQATLDSSKEDLNEHERIEVCENVVENHKRKPIIKSGGNVASYNPLSDLIKMPEMGKFNKAEEYYSTLFHELIHSTGHESRLKREGIIEPGLFKDHKYSKEELIAEFGSAYLCGLCEIDMPVIDNQASYIQHWLKVLKKDRRMLIEASKEAQKAVDFVLGTFEEKSKAA